MGNLISLYSRYREIYNFRINDSKQYLSFKFKLSIRNQLKEMNKSNYSSI